MPTTAEQMTFYKNFGMLKIINEITGKLLFRKIVVSIKHYHRTYQIFLNHYMMIRINILDIERHH